MVFSPSFIWKWNELRNYMRYVKIYWLSLTYNSFSSKSDLVFEPIFAFVYYAAHWFGPCFVCLVTVLTSSVVFIYYHDVIPYLMSMKSSSEQGIIIVYGHYLLMMIVFHYYMACTTNPGVVPKQTGGMIGTSVCKKCLVPKPPRTHHCSVCNTCRLKMDHHCPWLNNCVGHFNHRYFISFCIFMTLGTMFVIITTYPLFYHAFRLRQKFHMFKRKVNNYVDLFDTDTSGEQVIDMVEVFMKSNQTTKSYVIYLWILCFAVTVALGALTLWHVYLISRGETSIEKLINQKERGRLAKLKLEFVNLYDYGVLSNWKLLLGFHDLRSFVFRVLLPSRHHPYCDGVNWKFSKISAAQRKPFTA